MATVKQGDTVRFHYTGKLEDGTVFDESTHHGPLEVKVGESELIEGFELALVGMSPGESKRFVVSPEKAFGSWEEERVLVVDRSSCELESEPQVGQELELCGEEGEVFEVRVTAVSDSEVTVDANHPLAGRQLSFEVELLAIL